MRRILKILKMLHAPMSAAASLPYDQVMQWKPQTLTTWGRVCFADTRAAPIEAVLDVPPAGPGSGLPQGVIAYGGGRCYGDQSLNSGLHTVLTGTLNRLLSLDEETGDAVVEAGITFDDLSRALHGRGFTYPVSAATGTVTIGGAIANDIHSKNHHHLGGFGKHVNWIELMLADGSVIRTSRTEEPDIFRATVGGMGLSGIIFRASLRLLKVPSRSARVQYRPMPDLDALLDGLQERDALPPYWFGWIDALASGGNMGRGILETGHIAEADDGCLPPPKPSAIPFSLPGFLTRPAFAARLNRRRYESVPADGAETVKSLEAFYFPLDHIRDFNKIYGRRGFYSIHCGIPAGGRDGILALLAEVVQARAGAVTTVIKPMGGPGEGFLSFPMKGIALAIDLPNRSGVEDLHARLERITLDHGGRLYAAKDSLMSAAGFARMFPQLPDFRAVLDRIDPKGVFQSDMSRRLNIRGDSV